MVRKPSLKRALGVTSAKRKISKATGIPLTKSGRKRKVKNVTGCCIPLLSMLLLLVGLYLFAMSSPV